MSVDRGSMDQAVEHLRGGGLVAFPTETVYGLGADAFNPEAVRRVFEIKGRPAHNPLIVHVNGEAMARRVVKHWTPEAAALAREFWPGPLSIVLAKSDAIPDIVTAGSPNVGVRCPDHPLTLELMRSLDRPLVGPSANPSGRVSPTRAEHVRAAFAERDVMVLDGGACTGGIESTVLSLAGSEPVILRPGLIGPEEIGRVLGRRVSVSRREPAAAVHLESPGQMLVHYAPCARCVLFESAQLARLVESADGGKVVVVAHEDVPLPRPHVVLTLSRDPRHYAAGLYSALITADAMSPAVIGVLRPPTNGDEESRALWGAILDRVTRATTRLE